MKVMMNHGRRVLPPVASNKRKEKDFLKPSKLAKPNVVARSGMAANSKAPAPAANNQLLAGYLAYEFLANGTLLGQPCDPARAEAMPGSMASSEPKRMKATSSSSQKLKAESAGGKPIHLEKKRRYLEVADLLKGDGAHFPGIVNPTQLARFLRL